MSCPHERDVLDLVAIGQWPARADAALRTHAAGCGICAEVAAVAVAVREWADDPRPVKVPDAAVVWYRAQVRAKEEAARRASRPLLAAQLVALAAVILAVVTIGPSAEWYLALLPDLSLPALSLPTVHIPAVSTWSWLAWGTVAAVATLLLAGGLAWILAED
ncbi:MAG: hypothetical protein FJW21_13005 [Acidimicrobiia bacterium]|nr:hypothetical protein [Acidimicrobiia bacterium]